MGVMSWKMCKELFGINRQGNDWGLYTSMLTFDMYNPLCLEYKGGDPISRASKKTREH